MKKLGTDQRLKKKLQEILDLTTAENAAIDNANNPSASNPFATMADVESVELGADIVDALAGAGDPSSSNPFATVSDIADLGLDSDELDAIESSNNPSTANPFATLADLPEGGGIIDVTYAELVALMDSSGDGLVAGQFYRITDFATTYWMLDGSGNECNEGVPAVGEIEPLIVLATSENTLSMYAHSELFPTDEIWYDWNSLNYVNDAGYTGGGELPDWKGVIIWRRETILNNAAPWDIRNVKFRRWEVGASEWVSGASYDRANWVKKEGWLLRCMKANTDVVFDSTKWSYMLDLTDPYWLQNEFSNPYNIPVSEDSENYYDFPTFAALDDVNIYNNVIDFSNDDGYWDNVNSRLLNIVFKNIAVENKIASLTSGVTFGSDVFGINISNYCASLIFGGGCGILSIGVGSYAIIVASKTGGFTTGSGSKIGNYCNHIFIGDRSRNLSIKENCSNINIGTGVQDVEIDVSCQQIYIQYGQSGNDAGQAFNFGAYCTDIVIGKLCTRISFLSGCLGIVVGDSSYNLSFDNGCSDITISDNCYNIEFGNGCGNINIAESSYNVKIGQGSSYIELGDSSGGVNNIDIGQGCGGDGKDIVIGGGSYAIKIGDACHTLQFGNGVNDVEMSLDCNNIVLGDSVSGIIFQPYCNTITVNDSVVALSFGSNCSTIVVGAESYANTFNHNCYLITLPMKSQNNNFLEACTSKDFTNSSVDEITNGSNIIHRMCGTKIVGTYLEEQSDGSFVEVHVEDIIGVSV